MILSSLTVFASAAVTSNTLTQSMIDQAAKNGTELVIEYSMVVNSSLVIPEGLTVRVSPYATLYLENTLTIDGGTLIVNGYLSNPGNNLVTKNGGAWAGNQYDVNYYTPIWCPSCGSYYCGHYNTGWYGYGVCQIHGSTNVYCSTCGIYYCFYCNGGYHSHSTNTNEYCSQHNKLIQYCSYCATYHCSSCSHYSVILQNYCATHKQYKTYCTDCGQYYCTSCYGGYHYHNTPTYPRQQEYYYTQYSCATPTSNVTTGSKLNIGDTVSLSTSTIGATIYYTTDGSNPSIYKTKYTGPIKITEDVTIKAIAVKANMIVSKTVEFTYYATVRISFTDIANYKGLDASLELLVNKDIIQDGKTFGPNEGFTYSELEELCAKLGIKLANIKLDLDDIDLNENLSYNDFVYILYKALRSENYIKSPKTSGTNTIKDLKNYANVTDSGIYQAAFVSFIENGLFYDYSFNPANDATRLYLATALAKVVDMNNL